MKTIIISLLLLGLTFAQQKEVPHHYKLLNKNTTVFKKDLKKSNNIFEVFSFTISQKKAPFLRLYFDGSQLNKKSYISITSLYDGKSQIINSEKLKKWKNSSMFFNGDELLVEYYKNENDNNSNIILSKLLVGELLSEQDLDGIESICGTEDNRIPSSHDAVGRIVPIGCTAWISSTGQLVTAGHCVDGSTNFYDEIIEFNIPLSLSDGTIQHPDEEDQYMVNTFVYEYTSSADWSVFSVFENDFSSLFPIEAQNSSFVLEQTNSFTSNEGIRITGCGLDGPSPNFGTTSRNQYSQTQQTHLGEYHSVSGVKINYTADTQPGNSGSPIIHESNGKAIGVHTNGGCNSYGYNAGTSLVHSTFWNAFNHFTTVNQVLNNATTVGTVGL